MPNLIKIKSRSNLPEGDIPVITMTPLWSEPMETTLNTQTTILETLSGKESRTARLWRPLVGTEFVGIAADQAEHQLYKAIFAAWKDSGMYAVPLWMDAVQLDSDITTTPISYFFANGFNRLFRWFRYALLWESPEHCEVIDIKRIGKSGSGNKQIVCRGFAQVSNTYHAGAFLVPLAVGTIAQPDREFLCNTVNTIQISFSEKQGAILHDNYNTTTQTHDERDSLSYYRLYTPRFGNEGTADLDDVTYQEEIIPANYNQFDLMPNWDLAENIYSDQDDVYFDPIDGGAAKPYIINQSNKLRISLGYTLDREKLQYLLRFFEHHDGAKGEFWVPTWTADCVRDENTLSNVFVVKNDLSVEYYATLPPQTSIDDINFICKAVKCRFAEDTLEVTATTNNLYQVVCSFVQCECAPLDRNNEPVPDTQSKAIYLYELTKQGGNTGYYANYGYGVTVNGNNYAAADIAYTEIVKDVETLDNKIEVSCSGLDDALALNMKVEIKKGEIDEYGTISGLTSIFKGIVTKLSTESNGVRVMTVESNLYTLNNDAPRIKLQRQCNWRFGDSQCGIINEKTILARDDNNKYIYLQGDETSPELLSTDFLRGFSVGGINYNIQSVERITSSVGNAVPLYKYPLVYLGGWTTNELYTNLNNGWYNNIIKINDLSFKIIGNGGVTNYTQLKCLNKEPVFGGTVTISSVAHYKDFLGQVFQQTPTPTGYNRGMVPLTFKTMYFNTDLLMCCFYYAPAYVGNDDAGTLYLPKVGSTVSINGNDLVIKGYRVGSDKNYVLFEDDSSIRGLSSGTSISYDGKTLGWNISTPETEYNIIRLKVDSTTYSALENVSTLKLRRYCNKQISCCKECYNNVARFGGFPWLPNNTPYEYTENTSSGKK